MVAPVAPAGTVASLVAVLALAIAATACAPPPTGSTPAGTTTTRPVTNVPPTITGTARVGATVSTNVGTWVGSPTAFTLQWESCDAAAPASCRPVGDGTTQYVVAASELGRLLQVRVTATGELGDATQVSTTVGPVLPAIPVLTSRAGRWTATGTRRLCALFGSNWTCGTPSNVTLTFSLMGDCNGTGWCRLGDLTGTWGWSPSGGTACMTAFGSSYQAAAGVNTSTFTLDPDNTIGIQTVVPQNPIPLTAYITDAHATRVGDVTTPPLPCP